ncbi:HalOD1 output domain-containing protein [Natrononativus amylolyticus]|uniref:HalOD1 output domain-containing protein n=1 Tax=Natrononativus amylolyticus TaxID=2963434 RepID=UPI0020CCA4E4|nr:HalOD1 output domain-containing protein [Natrononativus amylolyticus]
MNKQATGGFDIEDGGFRKRVRYERDENEPPSVAVATAVAQFRGNDVTAATTRLYDYIDPEALDALFADRYDGQGRPGGRIRFEVDGLTVVVRNESVQVYPNA